MHPEQLINDYLDDTQTPEDAAALFQWIGAHPDHAKQFAHAAFLHRQLQHRLSAMQVLQHDATLNVKHYVADPEPPSPDLPATITAPKQPANAKRIFTKARVWAVAVAASLILGLLIYLTLPRQSAATLLATDEATWGAGLAVPDTGKKLPNRELTLESGLVRLGFPNGNSVIVEGPARFRIADDLTVSLQYGALTASVTPSGRGLRVSTPTAQVTDLGTEFGVRATATNTRIAVLTGKVSVSASDSTAAPSELTTGNAVDVTTLTVNTAPFEPFAFKRVMPADLRPLDLCDLLAGGNGRGSRSGVGVDAASGRTFQTEAVTVRQGHQQFHPITDHRVLNGSFVPGGTMAVDSAGHVFTFPATSRISYGLVWAGQDIPWDGELPITTTLPPDDHTPPSRVIVMHSNNGVTLDLDAIRALHRTVNISSFRARVGNSYRREHFNSGPNRSLASIHVVVDGVARFENIAFTNTDDPIDVAVPLFAGDRFLTLATTDGGDGNACDWILWTHSELVTEPRSK